MRHRTLLLLAGLLLAAPPGAAPLGAQRPGVAIALQPSPAQADGPVVRTVNVLDRHTRDLLGSGFPVRLHYRVELWTTGGWFNDLERGTEWDVVLRFDPLAKSYRLARILGDSAMPLGQFPDLAGATAALERPVLVPLGPRRGERQYYTVTLEIETLSLSDLDEVERWLRGELRPAVRGKRNPGTALTRGVRTLLVRLLGGEKAEYEARSETFKG